MMEYTLIALSVFSILFHMVAFGLESILFLKGAHKRFRVSAEDAEAVYPFAFNQGFYNLFLSISLIVGLVIHLDGHAFGTGLMAGSAFVMAGAGVILGISSRELIRVAILQGLPPVIILFLLL